MATQENKTLKLTLKRKWFEMILSGEKKEEYREIKSYWIRRLCFKDSMWEDSHYNSIENNRIKTDFYKFIEFKNGYSKNAPSFKIECKGICIGGAKPEWSDNWPGQVFIIKLGNVIK